LPFEQKITNVSISTIKKSFLSVYFEFQPISDYYLIILLIFNNFFALVSSKYY